MKLKEYIKYLKKLERKHGEVEVEKLKNKLGGM